MRFHKYIIAIASIAACFSITDATAQIASRGNPVSSKEYAFAKSLRSSSRSMVERLPSIDSSLIYQKEELYNASSLRGAYPFAVERNVKFNMHNSGQLYSIDGRLVWKLRIISNGAKSIGLSFDKFHLPEGARLFVYASNQTDVRGAFTDNNNTELGILTIAPIFSDDITVECQMPYSGLKDIPSSFELEVNKLYHGYKDLRGRTEHNQGEPWNSVRGFYCAPNVINYPEYSKQARATVLMVINGSTVCTGSLINNTESDGKPYILTSAHCVNNLYKNTGDIDYSQRTAAHTVFFFSFESPSKKYFFRGVEQMSISGSKVVALNEDADMCLLEMVGLDKSSPDQKHSIPASYRPYYEGWNISLNPKGYFVGIHHPSSAVKRYSRCADKELKIMDYSAGPIKWEGKHFHIKAWEVGTTAPGSSGSPLFDNQGLVIGALSGGNSYCGTPYDDYYWSLSKTWKNVPGKDYPGGVTRNLGKILDPNNSGNVICKGYDPYAPHSGIRISRVMVSGNSEQLEYKKLPDEVRGVGVQYNFPSKVRILGAYMVIPSIQPYDGSKVPKFDIKLEKLEKDPIKWEQVFFDHAKPASYHYYEDGMLAENICSTYDTTDIFIPVYDKENNLPYIDIDGPVSIVASILARDKGSLMPLLRLASDEQKNMASWFMLSDGSHVRSGAFHNSPYSGNYWVDLLVQPIGETTPVDSISGIKAFFRGKEFKVLFPTSDSASKATIRVFNYNGECVREESHEGLSYTLDLSILPKSSYIITVYFNGKKYSYPTIWNR